MSDRRYIYDANVPTPLPCGRVASISPLDGHAQKRLSPNREGKLEDVTGAITFAVARAVKKVNGRAFDPQRMESEARAMPGGSRLRAFMIARSLTYSSECTLAWKCAACGHDCTAARHLDEIADVPYPVAFLADGFTFVVESAGVRRTVRVVVDTGKTAEAFAAAEARGSAGVLDGPLAQVVELDGKALGKKDPFGELLDLPGDALDGIRAVVRLMAPRAFVSPAAERAWIEKANALGRSLGNDVPPTPEAEGDDEAPMPVLWVPQGGPQTRMQAVCGRCNAVSWQSIEAATDFFFPHLQRVIDE